MGCFFSFPKSIFPNGSNVFLLYLIIVSAFNILDAYNFISFALACLFAFSTLCSNYFLSKCAKTYYKFILFLKDLYLVILCLFFVFSWIYWSNKPNYTKGYIDGLEIALITIILMKCLGPKFSSFLLLFSINLINVFLIKPNLIIIIEMNTLLAFYFIQLFLTKREKKQSSKEKKNCWAKHKLCSETKFFLNMIFSSIDGKILILNKDSECLYIKDNFRINMETNKKTCQNDIFDEKSQCGYKIRKEIYGKCLLEVEILAEVIKFDRNEDFTLNFQNLTHYIFNKSQQIVFFIVESRLNSDERQLIYIIKQDDKAIFRLIPQEFINMLQKKNEIIQNYSQAISFVSHEFRTPLNCIINMLQALQPDLDKKLINNYIVPSLISSKFLLNLVNDLLDIAQMEAGKFKLSLVEFNLHALLDDTLQIISFQSNKRNIDLDLEIDHDVEMIKSDPNRLRQIVTNLLSNALKYSTSNGVITLSARRCQKNEIMISVTDTGLGIKKDDLSKLFKEFSKITDMQNAALNSQGIGLGLLISNKIANQLNENNGGIKVESELGKGSIFSLKIIDKLIEEKEFLMTDSVHDIDRVSEMEYKLISNVFNPFNLEETSPYTTMINKFSICEDNSVKTLPEMKTMNKASGLMENYSDKHKKKINSYTNKEILQYSKSVFFFTENATPKSIVYSNENDFQTKEVLMEEKKKEHNSSSEKKSSKTSENHYLFADAVAFTKLPSINDYKSKEELIEKKKDFLIHKMRSKCPCPFILAVDDNDFNNLVMTMHANRLQIPIITALSGFEALEKIKEQQKNPCCNDFKIIFMDIDMPLMNGLETFQYIKQFYEEKEQKLHVVPITGHSEGNEMLESAKKLMGEAIFKPISLEYFVIFLEKYMVDNLS